MYEIYKTLKSINDDLYLVIAVKISLIDDVFKDRALPIDLLITDGDNTVHAFLVEITNNKKEIDAFFTVDSFDNLFNNAVIQYGYDKDLENIMGIDNLENINPLPKILENIPYQVANNAWLSSVQ